MMHSVVELSQAFNMPAITDDDIEELRDMERYCYMAQFGESMIRAIDTPCMRRRDFLSVVSSTIKLGNKRFDVSSELADIGTQWFKSIDFWEVYEDNPNKM